MSGVGTLASLGPLGGRSRPFNCYRSIDRSTRLHTGFNPVLCLFACELSTPCQTNLHAHLIPFSTRPQRLRSAFGRLSQRHLHAPEPKFGSAIQQRARPIIPAMTRTAPCPRGKSGTSLANRDPKSRKAAEWRPEKTYMARLVDCGDQ